MAPNLLQFTTLYMHFHSIVLLKYMVYVLYCTVLLNDMRKDRNNKMLFKVYIQFPELQE